MCQQQHITNDRYCREWLSQKDIKKIMACESVPYKKEVQINKSGAVNTALSFADKAVKKSNFKNIVKSNILISTKCVDTSSFSQLSVDFSKKNSKTKPPPTSLF